VLHLRRQQVSTATGDLHPALATGAAATTGRGQVDARRIERCEERVARRDGQVALPVHRDRHRSSQREPATDHQHCARQRGHEHREQHHRQQER